MSPTIKEVAALALTNIERILSNWLPGGKKHGHEYQAINPTRTDSKLGSFSINCNTGAWADFDGGDRDRGGDVVSLIAYLEGLKQGDAAKRLAEFLCMATNANPQQRPASASNKSTGTKATPQSKKPVWRVVQPAPDDAPAPPQSHYKHGKPSMRWEYHNEAGQLLCWLYRYEAKSEDEKKLFLPLTFCEDKNGKREWCWQALPEPRPLYHLDKLTANKSAPVVVCEGEKAADAAALLFHDAVCITMLNGAQAPHKSDWKPLAGRDVWLWPDNDESGRKCMAKVCALAKDAGANSVSILNLSAFACAPGGSDPRPLPEKWDAADAVNDGWAAAHVATLMQSPDFIQSAPVETSAQPEDATYNESDMKGDSKKTSYFHCCDEGVFHISRKEQGGNVEKWRVCSKLEITASTRDAKNESWGRLLEFDDSDGTHHAWAMPMEMLSGDGNEYRRTLLSMGLQIEPFSKARNLLSQYIQTAQVERRSRCVDRIGWHGNVFVLPDRVIGENDEERVLFQSVNAAPSTFRKRKNISEWKKNVAALCSGNSRLLFAVSASFAAPLLNITGAESGGIHFTGTSSHGKTSALRAASSVWGGEDYMQLWRNTDNAIEATAAQHSDCLLALDEIGQVDPKIVGEVSYMLANEKGKGRANRTGGLREQLTWRIIFISSGEKSLSEYMAEAKKKAMAGQEVRMLSIPADAEEGHGMFENLHGYADGEEFSNAFVAACFSNYGTSAQPYIEKLIEHGEKLPAWVKKIQGDFKHEHVNDDASGQVKRAAFRFSLIGAAGELATKLEITGWQPGEAMQAAVTCFKAWLAQRGSQGNLEEINILSQVQKFFEAHGDARFTDWDRTSSTDSHAPRTINRAGYRKNIPALDDEGKPIYLEEVDGKPRATHTEYYVMPETFKSEVCAGFDYRAVCKLLVKRGCLMTDTKGFTRVERLPGGEGNARCFRITHKLFENNLND